MIAAYLICLAYAALGLLYQPGLPALIALGFIALSASPLLLAHRAQRLEVEVHHPPVGRIAFAAMATLGMLNLVLIAQSLGQGVGDLLSIDGFVETAAAATARRYEVGGASGNALLLTISLFLVYRIGAAQRQTRWWMQILAFMPVLLYTLLSTEKWPLFLGGMFYLLGMFAAMPARQALRRALFYVTVFAAIGGGMSALALVLRGFDGDILEIPAQLLHYILAPFSAFGRWYPQRAGDVCCAGGLMTFIGPADQLGFIKREAGVFPDNTVIYGIETNIYTAWRYLVQDFGDVGPWLACLLLVMVYLCCEELLKWRIAARMVRTVVIFSALISSAVTPFVHNSVALTLMVAVGYSAFVQHRQKNPSQYPHE